MYDMCSKDHTAALKVLVEKTLTPLPLRMSHTVLGYCFISATTFTVAGELHHALQDPANIAEYLAYW